jgi:hypothetical protein
MLFTILVGQARAEDIVLSCQLGGTHSISVNSQRVILDGKIATLVSDMPIEIDDNHIVFRMEDEGNLVHHLEFVIDRGSGSISLSCIDKKTKKHSRCPETSQGTCEKVSATTKKF